MPILTDKLSLIMPDRGEFPGEWDTPLNSNFESIDLILWKAYTNNSGDTQPLNTESVGSTWYKVAQKLLMIKGSDGIYHSAAAHIHDGSILDIPKIMLTDGRDIQGTLPAFMVGYTGLDAEKLGHKFANEYVSIGGTGIQVYVDQSTGLGAARILSVPGFQSSQMFNKVTVDISGRVIAGSSENTLSGLGITDGVTKTYADTTYATNFRVDQIESGTSAALQTWVSTNYAPITGNAGAGFSVLTNSGNAADAVSVSWATNYLASKNGDGLQSFLVKASSAATLEAVPRSQADTLYSGVAHNHNASYVLKTGDTISGALTVSGGITIPTGSKITLTDAPTLNTDAVNKLYVTNATSTFLTTSAAALTYASKAGNSLQTFNVAPPISSNNAATKDYVDTNSVSASFVGAAVSAHGSSGDHDNRYTNNSAYTRNTVVECKNISGTPNFLLVSGTDVDIKATLSEPLRVIFADGFSNYTGAINYNKTIDADIAAAFTGIGISATKYLALAYNTATGIVTQVIFSTDIINSYVEPVTPATDQVWHDYNSEKTFKWDGAVWVDYPCVYLAKVVTDAGGIPTITYKDIKVTYNFVAQDITVSSEVIGQKFKITPEGGYAISLINKTGANSVKGTLVKAGATLDESFETELGTAQADTIGAVYETGVADGAACWVIVAGIAQVLLADGTTAARGNWVIASTTSGRADATQPTPSPNNTLGEHTQHFKEIGHCLETKTAGTDILAKCVLHFN